MNYVRIRLTLIAFLLPANLLLFSFVAKPTANDSTEHLEIFPPPLAVKVGTDSNKNVYLESNEKCRLSPFSPTLTECSYIYRMISIKMQC